MLKSYGADVKIKKLCYKKCLKIFKKIVYKIKIERERELFRGINLILLHYCMKFVKAYLPTHYTLHNIADRI